MKTILATTCWLDDEHYFKRTQKWLDYYENMNDLIFDHIILVDNASSPENIARLKGSKFVVSRQEPHLTRASHLSYPFVWRAVFLMDKMEADKIIYMNTDVFLLSDKMTTWVNQLKEGWTVPWCKKHNFPEADLQILVKPNSDYSNFIKGRNYMSYNGQQMESILPVTVDRSLKGDRYSEYKGGVVPDDADFITQCVLDMEVKYKGNK